MLREVLSASTEFEKDTLSTGEVTGASGFEGFAERDFLASILMAPGFSLMASIALPSLRYDFLPFPFRKEKKYTLALSCLSTEYIEAVCLAEIQSSQNKKDASLDPFG